MTAQNKTNDFNEQYLDSQQGATPLFREIISPKIQTDGPIPFIDYMALCLYHPQHGYYTNPRRLRTGKKGDFYTSVSVGPCFGHLLAHHIHDLWKEQNQPPNYAINEWGAEDATLANDILTTLEKHFPALYGTITYNIIEPHPAKQTVQKENIHPAHQEKIHHHKDPASIPKSPGLTLANELIDALPIHLIQKNNNAWTEIGVTLNEAQDQFAFTPLPLSEKLKTATAQLPADLPDGYLTELPTSYPSILQELITPLSSGHLLLIDYGHEAEDYYAPTRTQGTLRTYYKHRSLDNPLLLPGQQDLTAHVNFTQLIQDATAQNLSVHDFTDQAHFLIHILQKHPNSLTPDLIPQFQTLTHPGLMGTSFKAVEFSV